MTSFSNNATQKILQTMIIISITICIFMPGRSKVLSPYFYAEHLSVMLFTVSTMMALAVKLKVMPHTIEQTQLIQKKEFRIYPSFA